MFWRSHILFTCAIIMCYFHLTGCENQIEDLKNIFSRCHLKTQEFDACMKRALNKMRAYFKIGIPDLGVAPFDPHYAKEVVQTRRIFGIGYTLRLKDVYERGWTQSTLTKFKTDKKTGRFVYSQHFPEKYLEGDYEFKSDAYGHLPITRMGHWNLTLRDYSQTTRIRRDGNHVEVRVEVDRIGDMEINVGQLLNGKGPLEEMLGRFINFLWKPGFAMTRPLINDLVSTAFTKIFTDSFGHFPVREFIKD